MEECFSIGYKEERLLSESSLIFVVVTFLTMYYICQTSHIASPRIVVIFVARIKKQLLIRKLAIKHDYFYFYKFYGFCRMQKIRFIRKVNAKS